jgi:hypothetical protein
VDALQRHSCRPCFALNGQIYCRLSSKRATSCFRPTTIRATAARSPFCQAGRTESCEEPQGVRIARQLASPKTSLAALSGLDAAEKKGGGWPEKRQDVRPDSTSSAVSAFQEPTCTHRELGILQFANLALMLVGQIPREICLCYC